MDTLLKYLMVLAGRSQNIEGAAENIKTIGDSIEIFNEYWLLPPVNSTDMKPFSKFIILTSVKITAWCMKLT